MMDGISGFLKSGLHTDEEHFRRFPLRRIQPVLRKFLTVFQLNLDRLLQHRQNIERFSSESADLSRELVYTLHSVEQLVLTVKQLKQTRFQVEIHDLPALDIQLTEVLNDAVLISAQFLVLLSEDKHKKSSSASSANLERGVSSEDMIALESIKHCSICTDLFEDPRGLPCMHTFCLRCLQQYAKNKPVGYQMVCPMCRRDFTIPIGGVKALPKNFLMGQLLTLNNQDTTEHGAKPEGDAAESERSFAENKDVKALEAKLQEFNDIIQTLFLQIQEQDAESRSVNTTAAEQEESSPNLSNFKLMLLPVAGAMIGGAIAGPVGLVAGLKAGKMAAVGGSLLGLTGGTFLKGKKASERSLSVNDASDESVELCQVRSTSSPSISCQQRIGENGE